MPLRLNVNHEFFRRIRREKGITQTELARLAGCTQSAVSMFESGRHDAVNDTARRQIGRSKREEQDPEVIPVVLVRVRKKASDGPRARPILDVLAHRSSRGLLDGWG